MRGTRYGSLWMLGCLLLIFGAIIAGCCSSNTSQLVPPTVLSSSPAASSDTACPNATVSIVFSEAMNPATINSSTFTLTGGSTPVAGVVSFNGANNSALFTPSALLTAGVTYTAGLSTAVADQYGNKLAVPFTYSFSTAANGCHPPPTVVSITPALGSAAACPNVPVVVTFSEPMNPATINATDYTLSPGVTSVITHDVTNSIYTLTPSAGLAAGTQYTTNITTAAEDTYGNFLATPFTSSFITAANGCHPPPTVVSITPALGSTTACPNVPVVVTFSEPMNPATINAADYLLSPAVVSTVSHDATNTIYTLTPSSVLASGTLYTANVTTAAQDTYGNFLAAPFTSSFTTAANGCHPPPTVSGVSPAAGAVGICPNSVITASFSEAMNAASINATTFTVVATGGAAVVGTISYNTTTNVAMFTPTTALALNTVYTATLTTGVEDTYGNFLVNKYTWNFTTGATLCVSTPPPVLVSPPSVATDVCPLSVISASFVQAMNPLTINTTTFTVSAAGVNVAGVVTGDITNKIYTFTPTLPLALSTLYTATITTGAQDTAGNALAANYTWTFTTGATNCTGPIPVVVTVSPSPDSIGACPNAPVSATFNIAMNPATINTSTFLLSGETGVVTLDSTDEVALYTPATTLALDTTYTATITTGAQSSGGSALAANYVWNFTTALQPCQPPVPLGSAANFEIVGASTVTSTGPTVITGGNLGLSPGSGVTGFPPGTLVLPAVMHVTDPIAAQAELDVTVAYNYAAGLPGGTT